MSFITAIKTCFSKYIDFSGRASRSEFWWFALFTILVSFLLSWVDMMIFGIDPQTQAPKQPISWVFSLLVALPTLAVSWRRLHDIGRTGLWSLAPWAMTVILMIGIFMGIAVFGALQNAGMTQDSLQPAANGLTMVGLTVFLLIYIALSILLLIWFLKPSQIGTNLYGPQPM